MKHHDLIREKIIFMITNDLTVGRSDNGLVPFTSLEIDKFIEENKDNIEKTIETIIREYDEDGELGLLIIQLSSEKPMFDIIGEYLYEFVDTSKYMFNE